MKKMTALRRPKQNESGTALIELAFILPLLLLIFMGIVDLGRAFYYSNTVAREPLKNSPIHSSGG
jgi:Flp pilus assembly protein TadG